MQLSIRTCSVYVLTNQPLMQFWIFTLADFLADRYRQNADIGRIAQFQSYRVRTHLSSSNSMTFHDFFHDIFKFSRTLGLDVCSKTSKTFPFLDYFLTLNSSTDTTLVSTKMRVVCAV